MKKIIILFVIAIIVIVAAAIYTATEGMFGIFIPLTLLFPAAILIFVFSLIGKSRKLNEILLKTGEPASAKILSVSDTGVSINNSPRIALQLEVTPRTGSPFNAKIYTVVSRLKPFLYQPGMILHVRYDPNNLKAIAIESSGEDAVRKNIEIKPLFCPACGGQVKVSNITSGEKIISCSYCGTIISMQE
jgi:hypothetical protein